MRRTILVADDSPTIQRLVIQTFAGADFEIISVSNGDAAIEKLDELRPSLVLADIYMPGRNGYEVCAHVTSHPELNRTPVVLLVGAFEVFDEQKAQEAGASAKIIKPFEPRALLELADSLIDAGQGAEAATLPAAESAPPKETPALSPETEGEWTTPPSEGWPDEDEGDLLNLASIFKEEPPSTAATSPITEEEIERIAERVMKRLSTQAIESVAWKVVPGIAERIVREELKRIEGSGAKNG